MSEQPGDQRAKLFKVGEEEVRIEGDEAGTEAGTETGGAGVSGPVVTVVGEPVRGAGESGAGAVDDSEADVNLGGDTSPRPVTIRPEVATSADAATTPDSGNVEAGSGEADMTTRAESPQSRDVGAWETEADKSTAGSSDGIDDEDVGAGPDGGRVRLGEETSSSIKYSQEITSPEDEPEREGRSLATSHHEVIKQWAEERGGTPATVQGTEHGDHLGVLRLDFSGDNENLRHVSWEEWFDTFDARRLNFIYQEQRRDGRQSNFFRLESPDREDG
ncbi:MAG: hypothetical protein ACTHJJ_16240 [Intrasporangium sp.]|uniref:hypothetical protein n=1 Tax=Intrasporangium sp. TaxID=1925024 RepID=UPI003F7F0216